MVDELRRKAEEQLNHQSVADDELNESDLHQVFEELKIHQIELELQNDELRRTQNELELSRQHYFELFNFAPIDYVVIDKQGIIVQANLTVCQLLRVERAKLINKPLMLYLHSGFVTVFLSALEQSHQTRSTCKIQVRTKADVPQYLLFKSLLQSG